MTEQRLAYLLSRHLENSLTAEEQAEWETALHDPELREQLNQLIDSRYYNVKEDELQSLSPERRENIIHDIFAHQNHVRPIRRWLSIAASILLIIGLGGYFLLKSKLPTQQSEQTAKQDIPPGHNQATLTLAGGQKIILTKGLKGLVAKQGQTAINANANNITYRASQPEQSISYNTLSTAKGEQSPYPLVLADGTKVWLNAESSITFPTAFNNKERIVKLTGEAYFEVKHNAQQPFKVETAGQVVEDIGTHFNVNAYSNEPVIQTTLLEGGVRVNGVQLQPGQQARIATGTTQVRLYTVDAEAVVAWKNGLFEFDNTPLEAVMRQLARWYDVNVIYEGNIPDRAFTGKLYRNINASQLLDVLTYNKIHYRINGKTLTIMP